jgi:hypothetical protein
MQKLILNRESNLISSQEVTIEDIKQMENYEIVKIRKDELNSISTFNKYEVSKNLEHLNDCYSVKTAKVAIELEEEYVNAKNHKDWGKLKQVMFLQELSEEKNIASLYKALQEVTKSSLIEFNCIDYETGSSKRLLLQNTNIGISISINYNERIHPPCNRLLVADVVNSKKEK